jgi:hypothetical protein
VYIGRDRTARLDADAVSLLAEGLHFINLPLDRARAASLSGLSPVELRLRDSGRTYVLDPGAERPRLQPAQPGMDGPLVIEGPDEEIIRFISGRHFVPGARSELQVSKGSAQDLGSLRRAFR